MRKYIFIFLVFHFSFCPGQDTLFYDNGGYVAVNVLSVSGDSVFYSIPPNKRQVIAKLSTVDYIKYKDGTTYSYKELKAKRDSIDEIINPNQRLINIDIGIGASAMESQVPGTPGFINSLLGTVGPNFLTETPVYNFTICYNVTNTLSIGIGGDYQSLTDNPAEQQQNTIYTVETERITRTNFSVELYYHYYRRKKIDIYSGFRIGLSTWTDQVIPNSNTFFSPILTLGTPSEQKGSFQLLLCGFRLFPIYNLGIHLELGIGTPYIVEAGITFRFKTRKDKSK